MRRIIVIMILVSAFTLLLAACGGSDDDTGEPASGEAGAGDAARGESLYKKTAIGAASAPGCITCHSLDKDVTLVGPTHAGIGTAAASRVAGMSAEEFLRQSIIEPDEEVTENFSPGVMYQNYGSELSEQEIADLVAFLTSLK
jgi:cytochrome c553